MRAADQESNLEGLARLDPALLESALAAGRTRVAAAPAQLADLTRSAIASGCDPQALVDAVTDAATA